MEGCDWKEGDKRFRYDKTISPQSDKTFDDTRCVVSVLGEDVDSWCDEVKSFIDSLVSKNVITDLNQIAFLFHSVKNKDVVRLTDYLESHGIPVFSPRSAQFFCRDVIRQMVGLFFFLFPQARPLPDEMSCTSPAPHAKPDAVSVMPAERPHGP